MIIHCCCDEAENLEEMLKNIQKIGLLSGNN